MVKRESSVKTSKFLTIPDNPTASLSRESAILLNLARIPVDTEISEEICACIREDVDWSDLVGISHNHGVLPLLYKQLQSLGSTVVPRHILDYVKVHYCSTALLNFYLAQELLQLLSLFRTKQLSAIPYKGPVLAVSAYGSLALRQFLDLDILVDRRDYDRSKEVLLAEGFQLQADYGWESHFISSNGGYCLDLHQGLTPRIFPYPVEFSNLWQRRHEIALCGEHVPNLSHEDSLLILCVQVAKDSWAKQPKLAKLCDIAQLLHKRPGLDWEWLLTEAAGIGARGTLSFALALAHDLLGIPIPAEISREMAHDRSIASLVAQARNEFLLQLSPREPDSCRPVAISEHARFHSQLRERFRDKLPYHLEPLRRSLERLVIPNARDRSFLALPKPLHCLYSLIRPFRLVYEYLLHPFAQALRLSHKTNTRKSDRTEHRQDSSSVFRITS